MDQPKRKPNRLPEYDYSSPGAYFVTICTQDRRCILSSITVGEAISLPHSDEAFSLTLTDYGALVRQAIQNIPNHYPSVTVDNYVIMPNHVHLILRFEPADDGRIISSPTAAGGNSGRLIASPTLSTVVGQMKRWVSKEAGRSLWQRSYHEHVIRGEADYREIWEYIDRNPAKWAEDRYWSKE